jgi:hypothetical protein
MAFNLFKYNIDRAEGDSLTLVHFSSLHTLAQTWLCN